MEDKLEDIKEKIKKSLAVNDKNNNKDVDDRIKKKNYFYSKIIKLPYDQNT